MNKFLLLFLTAFMLISCGESFKINGTSEFSPIDGEKLYLKVINGNDIKTIDSCEVIHGTFKFSGSIDTTRLAEIFVGDKHLISCILESGNINIKIGRDDNTNVTGTQLNDSLNSFFDSMDKCYYKKEELNNAYNNAIMDGTDPDAINDSLANELMKINKEQMDIVTKFIKSNYDNILGPAIFKMVVSDPYTLPMLSVWIEEIKIEATDKFKNDAFVKDFFKHIQEKQNMPNEAVNSDEAVNSEQTNP